MLFFKIINFIIDFITGFHIKNELANILAMDKWSRQQIENDQKFKFSKLSVIAGNSGYYRDYKGKDINEYPIMQRDEFKKNHDKIRTNIRKPYSIQFTSGSTSSPVTLVVSKEMLLAKRVSHQKMLKWFGLKRESREFKIGGVKENLKTKIYYYLRNKRFINSFRITNDNINSLIKKYNKFKPEILYGYPSAIYNLIQYAHIQDISLSHPDIIVTHAENLYDDYITKFKTTFPTVKIINQYWSTEANIAVTCPKDNLHVDEDTVICELINKDENGVGDLLITNLYSFDLPIIRYKIGDRVKFSENKCSCGRNTKIIEYIEGRNIDIFELPDGRRIPITAIYLSRFSDNIVNYQLAYHKSKALMEFRYIPINKDKSIDEKNITNYFKNDFGLSTAFMKVDTIQNTSSGKLKKLILLD